MSKILGIDLGTTNSCMSVLEGDEPTIIATAEGTRTLPSVVAWVPATDGSGKSTRIVGKAALNQAVTNYANTIYSVKRFIGRTFSELTPQDLEGLTYEIRQDPSNDRPLVVANNTEMLPEQISAAVLSRLKEDAEAFLGEPVTEAVITVPAYFNDSQRQATKDAGAIAGLNVQRIVNEPTAAALAYGFGKDIPNDQPQNILVFDLGGGTFDVSILSVSNDFIEVIATAGDNHLGGDIWDSVFTRYIIDKFKNDFGVDLSTDPMTHTRVLEAARKAKEDLSNAPNVQINIPFITVGPNGPLHLDYTITREEFEAATKELLDRLEKPVREAMVGNPQNPINLTNDDISSVLLVGGSTRMPAVQEVVRTLLGKEPSKVVNPDEIVAQGASVQGGILNNECSGIVLADVCSMSIGIRTYVSNGPDKVHIMIPRNTPIPADSTEIYTTSKDNQDNVEIILVQREDPDNADSPENKVLGTTVLSGIPPMPARQPRISVTISYNVEGIIEISATELSTGQHIEATIEGSTKLSDSEVMMLAAQEDMMLAPAH